MIRFLLCLSGLLFSTQANSQTKIQLDNFVSGFTRPVDISHCGDSRLFITEQAGKIWIVDTLGVKLPTPFLDIDPRVNSSGNEQGLLGLAFHPNYVQNGYFYVNYINSAGNTRIVRFNRDSTNANQADPNSELLLLAVTQPYSNHNGGCLKFGPDGYLYCTLGDGGNAGDPNANGQNKKTFLGKMLRINVDSITATTNYAIPADNPFANNPDYFPEIWALGLRNTWRFSFDRLTGDIWMGDVGQNKYEEVDFEPAHTGGRNYGWRCYEGLQPYNTAGCLSATEYNSPVLTYPNPSKGCSITGGFIYRGSKYPDLYGVYLVADYCSGRFWSIRKNPDNSFVSEEIANLGDYEFSTFGEDVKGELYVALLTSGKIQKIHELCSPFSVGAAFPNGNALCVGSSDGAIVLTPSGATGTVNYTWSTGATTASLSGLALGSYSVTATDGNGCSRSAIYSFTQQGPDQPHIVSNGNLLCNGASLVVSVQNLPSPHTLIWTDPSGQQTTLTGSDSIQYFDVNMAGTYSVAVLDSLCTTMDSIFIDQEIAIDPIVTLNGDSLSSATPWPAYQWYFNNQPIPGATDSLYVATESGIYELYATSANGCVYQSGGVSIVISQTQLPASVKTFDLSPNPSSGLMSMDIRLQSMQRMRIFLLDAREQQIFSQTKQADALQLPIDLRALPDGTYFLHIQLENGEKLMRKVIKR